MLACTGDKGDLNEDFPVYNKKGVSSIIIQPSESWEIYAGAHYNGNTTIEKPGDYPDCSTFYNQDNAVIQSVRKFDLAHQLSGN